MRWRLDTTLMLLTGVLVMSGCVERDIEADDVPQPVREPASNGAASPSPTPILTPRPANQPPSPPPEVAERVDTRFGVPCSFYIDYDLEPHSPIEDLAWSSEHIVVGEVTEVLGPDWGEPDNVDRFSSTRGCLEIMTDYIFEVEDRFHGENGETMRIRAPGGELDGYEQLHGLAPELNVGDRYLFFLFKAPESEMLPDAWAFDLQRARGVRAGDEITTGYNSSMTRDEIARLIDKTLAGEPPPVDERHRALWGSAESPTFQED